MTSLWRRPGSAHGQDETMESQTFDDVFDALADTPAQAASLKARSELLSALQRRVGAWGLAPEAAAARLAITRPRLADLTRGKINKFSLDDLINMTTAAGLVLELRIEDAA
jgi:predicted XRE-type DNA-binding protein